MAGAHSVSWTAPAFLTSFKTALVADPVIAARTDPTVKVLTYWPGPEDRQTDAVILYRVRPGQLATATMGDDNRRKDDLFTVEGQIEVLRPGAGEDIAGLAATALVEIFDRVLFVANQRPSVGVGTQTLSVTVGDMDYSQFPTTVGTTPVRVAVVSFGIEVRVRVSVPAS